MDANTTLGSLLKKNNLGLTVYSPDAISTGHYFTIHKLIQSRTDLKPVRSFIHEHNAQSVERFYEPRLGDNSPNWHLVRSLFESSPSIVVLWHGEDACSKLDAIKGRSHPIMAANGSVRSRFWIDNSVCNLMHSSDNSDEILRELNALDKIDILSEIVTTDIDELPRIRQSSLWKPQNKVPINLLHNGMYRLFGLVQEEAERRNINLPELSFDTTGSAISLYEDLREIIDNTVEEVGSIFADLWVAFQLGDQQELTHILSTMTDGEFLKDDVFKLVICSGAASAPKWQNRHALSATLLKISSLLLSTDDWCFSGSAALRLYGLPVVPNDIDIWCDTGQIENIQKALGGTISKTSHIFGETLCLETTVCGWPVEVTGSITINSGKTLTADFRIDNIAFPIQAPEELFVELMLMDRPEPKDDQKKATTLRKVKDLSSSAIEVYQQKYTALSNRLS